MKQFMPEASIEQRLNVMKDTCDKYETGVYFKDLDQNDMDSRRETLTDNLIQQDDLDTMFALEKVKYKIASDPLKQERALLLQELKTRKAQISGTIFYMANHEEGLMEAYDENGEFVSSRRLRAEERQSRMFAIKSSEV